MKNRKVIYDAPIYMFIKKHYCPECATVLKTKKVRKIVNSKSKEASGFDFGFIDVFFHGDVEFTWYVFYCENCHVEISRKEMKKHEADMKGIK